MEARLVIVAPTKSRKTYTVRLPLVVGRGDESKFRIQQDSVSRRHCEFTVEDGVVHVTDLGSTNGTHVGGKRIEAHAATAVPSGAEVRIGAAILRVEYAAAPRAAVVAPPDDDTVPLSAVAAVAGEAVSELPELEPVAEALPDLEPVAEAPVELEAVEPPPETAAVAPPGAPPNPGAIATPPQAGEPAFPEPVSEAAPADFAALAAAAPAPPPPAEGSFDFLGGESAAPPASDDKLDDFFKSLS